MSTTQSAAQAAFNPLYTDFTITGCSVKFIFPDEFGGNNPIAWCMAYSDVAFQPGANVSANPELLQQIQGS